MENKNIIVGRHQEMAFLHETEGQVLVSHKRAELESCFIRIGTVHIQ